MSEVRHDIRPGLTGRASVVVTSDLTAAAMGSGDVDVYATPAALALLEAACVDALSGALDDEWTSVGVRVEMDHVAPSKPGASIVAAATLESVEGRGLTFSCEARDGDRLVARATHRRVLVARATFGS